MNRHSAAIHVSAVAYELVRRRVAELRAAGQPVTLRSVFTEAITHGQDLPLGHDTDQSAHR